MNFLCEPIQQLTNMFFPETIYQKAVDFAKELHDAHRLSMKAAQDDCLILRARRFVKKHGSDEPRMLKLQQELLAAKLGIHASVFEHNPEFETFAAKHHLEQYICHYGHQLIVDDDQHISLLVEGIQRCWNEISNKWINLPKHNFSPNQTWIYGQNGLQDRDLYDWTELQPYKYDDPAKWGNQYIFEFCACCSGEAPRVVGDHGWFRLKTAEGAIYSIGLYRPDKASKFDVFGHPLRLKKGTLMQPDISEFWRYEKPDGIKTIETAITKEQFLQMKAQIEADKRDNKETFHLLHGNCTKYADRIAKIANIELSLSVHYLRGIFSRKIITIYDSVSPYIPHSIWKICEVHVTVFSNLLQLILGASIVDVPGQEAHITSFWHLFDSEKLYMHHPYFLGTDIRKRIVDWRNREIAKISPENKELIQKIRFSLPSECLVSS